MRCTKATFERSERKLADNVIFHVVRFLFLVDPSSSCHSEARSAVRIALLSHFTMMRSLRRYAPQDDMVFSLLSFLRINLYM